MSSNSPVLHSKNTKESISKISGPFLQDTAIIIEKFVEAVKDLFHMCYKEPELYKQIKAMPDEEMFSSLTEYLEDVKSGIYEALSDNLDKMSLKFLSICDNQKDFNKYLKHLKEKWKETASMAKKHKHPDRKIREAKEILDKLASSNSNRLKSLSKRVQTPQRSEFISDTASKSSSGTKITSLKRNLLPSEGYFQEMPISESKGGQYRNNQTPTKDNINPKKTSYSMKETLSSKQDVSSPSNLALSPKINDSETGEYFQQESREKLVIKKTEHLQFTLEQLDTAIIRKHHSPSPKQVYLADQFERLFPWNRIRKNN